MRIPVFLLIVFAVTASCNSNPSAHKSDSTILKKKTIALLAKDITPQGQVVSKFYNWFLKGPYLKAESKIETPEVKLNKDSIYQINFESQFDSLKQTGFFSKDFFENQIREYNGCNIQLKKVKVKDVDKCGCSPTELIEGNACDFLTYHVWTGGQGETLNKVTILKTQTTGNTSKVTVALGDKDNVYSKPEVMLINEGGAWRISRIKINYE